MLKYFAFILVNICQISVYAQSFIPGIRLGVNMSNLQSEQFSGTAGRLGLDVAITFTGQLSDHADLISEFSFSQKGATINGYLYKGEFENVEDTKSKFFFNTLQYALIFNYYIKAPNFSIQAGPFIG